MAIRAASTSKNVGQYDDNRADGKGDQAGERRGPRRIEFIRIETEFLASHGVQGRVLVLHDHRSQLVGFLGVQPLRPVDQRRFLGLGLRIGADFSASSSISCWYDPRWLLIEMYSPAAMEKAPASRPA